MALPDVLRKSVTKEDAQKEPHSGTILHFMLPAMPGSMGSDLSPFWTIQRDWQLYQTLYRESQWANAISKAISKMASQSWEVDGDVPMRVRKAREMLMAFDLNRGWVPGLAKHLQAFLLTGNGAFIEIVHQTGAPGSKVLGLVHLDTFRCTRTGDPDFPVIYRDRLGAEHVMKPHQVMLFSDMPDQSELWYGVGHCAAERAYNPICRMEAIERFVLEKTAGKRPLALYIVNGPTQTQLETAIKTAKEDSAAKGLTTYMGAALMTMVDPTATPGVVKVDLAGLPDGFEAESERKNAYLLYANAIGIDPQLLDPDLLASRAMGTGAQSKVISEKQEGIGLASWRKAFEHGVNEWSLDEKTTFAFEEVDLDAEKKQADVDLIHATVIATLATPGILNVPQSIQMGVDWDLIPEEFLPVDQTPDTTITDYQKPEGEMPVDTGLSTPGEAVASALGDRLGLQPAVGDTASIVANALAQYIGVKEFGLVGDVGAADTMVEAALKTIRSVLASRVRMARRQGMVEAEQSMAFKELQRATSILAETEHNDDSAISQLALAMKALMEMPEAAAPQIIVNVPEYKADAPVVNVTVPELVIPAPLVTSNVIVRLPTGKKTVRVIRDEHGTMIGSEEVFEEAA